MELPPKVPALKNCISSMLGSRKKNQRLAIGCLRQKCSMQETLTVASRMSLYMFRKDNIKLETLPDLVFSGKWQHFLGKFGDEKKK